MTGGRAVTCLLLLAAMPGCDNREHIAGPYYLMTPENRLDTSLFYCFEDGGCAGDSLPDATVFAAGSDARHIVLARHPRSYGETWAVTNTGRTEYFYLRRQPGNPEPNAGWSREPGAIAGPLSRAEFERATERLNLPPFTIVLDDLAGSGDF